MGGNALGAADRGADAAVMLADAVERGAASLGLEHA